MPPVRPLGVRAGPPVAGVKVTPAGNAPVTDSVGDGVPVAVTVKVPAPPTVNVVALALVIAGAALTVSVKLCVALAPTPLAAPSVSEYVPAVPPAGVPERTPVAGFSVTPEGSAPVTEKVGAGKPVAVTVKVPAFPVTKVVLLALVIAGA